MKAAVSALDITPPIGLPIGGNVRKDNKSRGAHDSLYCNIVILESEGNRVCLLGFDLLGLSSGICKRIKALVEEKTGIKRENIVITAIHTHSGPAVIERGQNMDGRCREYLEAIAERVAAEAALTVERTEAVKLKISKKMVFGLSFNRRLVMKDGPMKMNWEGVDIDSVERESGPIDPELTVISIGKPDGRIMGMLVNFTLHPAVLVGKDWLWSRDYIHYLDTYVKNNLGQNVVIHFTNGAEGNVNHINFRDKNQGRGFEEAQRIGEELAAQVLQLVKGGEDLKADRLYCRSRIISLPLRPISEEMVRSAEKLIMESGGYIPSLLDGVPDEVYARAIIELSQVEEKKQFTEIQAIRLGEVVIATLPGEAFAELGLDIKKRSAQKYTMLFGLANDYIGYIPTCEAFDEGGYETKTGHTSKLDKAAGELLTEEITDLIKELLVAKR